MSNTSLLGSFGGQAGDALMFRNKLVNGCMRVWQRATSGAHTGNQVGSYVSADRWKLVGHQSGVSYLGATLERSTDVPAGALYSAKAISTAAGIDDYVVGQIIESANTFDLVGKTVTFSAQMKKLATLTGAVLTIEISYLNAADTSPSDWLQGGGMTLISSRSINSADFATSWGQYTLTTGVLPAQAANGIVVRLCLRGSNLGSGDLFAFTEASLEAGPVSTPFERRPYGMELQLCQRYCYVLRTGQYNYIGFGGMETPSVCNVAMFLPQIMRSGPLVESYANPSSIMFEFSAGGGMATNYTTISANTQANSTSYRLQFTGGTGGTAGAVGAVRSQVAEVKVVLSAEL